MNAKKHTQKLLSLVIALLLSTTLVACGGKSKKEAPPPAAPETGSFITTYTVMDAQGRKTGTLTLDPRGTAELKDVEGNVIGSFTSKAAASAAPMMEKTEEMSKEKEMK
jgi:predicted small lipoprotein YifL